MVVISFRRVLDFFFLLLSVKINHFKNDKPRLRLSHNVPRIYDVFYFAEKRAKRSRQNKKCGGAQAGTPAQHICAVRR